MHALPSGDLPIRDSETASPAPPAIPAVPSTETLSPGAAESECARSASDTSDGPRELPAVPGYEIRAVLGRGGMGVVYAAHQIALKRTVALKMVLVGGHATAADLRRFQAEAEAVARLHHPNVVQI